MKNVFRNMRRREDIPRAADAPHRSWSAGLIRVPRGAKARPGQSAGRQRPGQSNITPTRKFGLLLRGLALGSLLLVAASSARADLELSHVIIDLQPERPPRDDIELLNNGSERLYAVVEPAEIKSPGMPNEQRVRLRDPQQLGLLISPARLILEPGQRRFVRIAALALPGDTERIYRVTIKPVVGELSPAVTGVKVLVGYDVLVILRPKVPNAIVTAMRSGRALNFRNDGNTNAELILGQQCDAAKCVALPPTRLYAGSSWRVMLPHDGSADYTVKVGEKIDRVHYP